MAELLIMRHGEAAPGYPDHERRLTERGEDEARAMGRWLADRSDIDVANLRILASPFVRAQQTAALVMEMLPGNISMDTLEIITPDDPPEAAVDWLTLNAGEAPLLLVSHMPLVACLTGLLVEGREQAGVGFATAAIAELEADIYAAGCARLVSMTHPASLA
ncbi:phosphohistidine phosphatase SixA [Halomonas denitrificans]|uniref:phosphohistidine phosphatase SixA n=1 Tax=Halomonas TaxID=2745 RepID=UPI001C98602E|nr:MULTISPECIES: phosphohistidine phosphatase SixA [Halomonas]MED5294920.1 phosphohistidine phosphatase SixA [Pseudomonadota bacterium]MBY6207885.1 phosphohistidine phosphatase SixA [Halomonas sp. DP3Y7-2]MBY6228694.1 phosphohistidine phosphatase SixA [Halomonas sp. DP3Y7-1]MCA0916760.1 phosphohistidine phosphatase SixA [Halomonas denitrificans]MCA0975170.1 phosphohistidine phosphatase SixA [Halomonas denitrificans]